MEREIESKLNLETGVWAYSSVFRTCKQKTLKNVDYTKAGSDVNSDAEV